MLPTKENVGFSILLSIIIPAIILIRFSNENSFLGVTGGFLIALTFPFVYGIYDAIARKKLNIIPALGIVSVFLTGGIGLLELPSEWIAYKEAGIPFILAVVFLILVQFRPFWIKRILATILHIKVIEEHARERNTLPEVDTAFRYAGYIFVSSFVLSTVLNFILAKVIITSPTGTSEFSAELGKMIALSFPVIAIPAITVSVLSLIYLLARLKKISGLALKDMLINKES